VVGFRPLRLVSWLRRGLFEKLNTARSSDTLAYQPWRDELAQMRDLAEEGLAAQQRMLSSCLEHLIQQRGLLLNVENGLINRVAEIGQRIEALQSQIANQLGNLDQRLTNDLSDLRRSIIGAEIHGRLGSRAGINTMRDTDTSVRLPSPLPQPTLDATFRALEERYPRLFSVYRELLEAGERSYEASPAASLSVYDNPGSVIFRAFCLPNLRGAVLDIGCGPVAVPIYLQGYDLRLVAGIDPFGSADTHPFLFVRAVAEGIPWADESFDTVVVATSFDHLLDLSLGLSEMARVLKPNGELIAWVYYVPGMPPYDPDADNATKMDEFHLFHLDKPWFLPMMARHFAVLEELNIDGFSHFYRFARKSFH
jgi:SAM-dependent methyltransferase